MLEFKNYMNEFLRAKHELKELKEYAEREAYMMHFDAQRTEERGAEIFKRYQENRTNVARLITEATAISDACGIPTQLTLLPPPLIGGYGRKMNVYQAAIEAQLPFDFELPYQQLTDTVDQTIFACERLIRDQPSAVKEVLQRTPRRMASLVGWFFPREIQRVIFGWTIVVMMIGLFLRYVLGFHLEDVGKLVTKWVFK